MDPVRTLAVVVLAVGPPVLLAACGGSSGAPSQSGLSAVFWHSVPQDERLGVTRQVLSTPP
jgi:hypothetical protein